MAAQLSGLRSCSPAWWRSPVVWLAVVAVVHAASPLIVLGVHWWFGIDETVYLSQVNKYVQPGFFSAPRARGSTLIAAPVTLLTSSTAAVRIWLSAMSGVGLFLGFAPWLRLRRSREVPLAAALFSTLWTVIYYGFTVMPNEWVAYGSVAACGLVIVFLVEGRWQPLAGASCAVAVVALFRPSDALYLLVGLALGGLLIDSARRRRVVCLAVLTIGLLSGVLEWLIEAQIGYGGIMRRVHAAQAENGGGGLHFAGVAQARALAGPTLCRNGCHADAPVVSQLWWVVLGLLVTAGVTQARRRRGVPVEMMASVVGLVLASQYIFTITYAAPRFLIPAYALLSVPCAAGATRVSRWAASRTLRVGVTATLAAALLVHAGLQVWVVTTRLMPMQHHAYLGLIADARYLRGLGVHSPCLVVGGSRSPQLAYATGCADTPSDPASVLAARHRDRRVVWLAAAAPPHRRGIVWTRIKIDPTGLDAFAAYLSCAAPDEECTDADRSG